MAATPDLSAEEQYLLELINRARLDPAAEARRFGIDLNSDLSAGTLDAGSRQVLAPNLLLSRAAAGHSQWMLESDIFNHTGAGGSQPWDRAAAQGYTRATIGENISARMTSGTAFPAAATIEAHHEGLFRSAGHRVNLLNDVFKETGLAVEVGNFVYQGRSWLTSMLTEIFGAQSATGNFLTGVVYADRNGDRFYSLGEGQAGASFTVSGDIATSGAAGGYALDAGKGTGVAVSGKTAAGTAFSLTVDMSQGNVKLDIVNDKEFLTSGSLTLGKGIGKVTALGLDDLALTGSDKANTLNGNAGSNVIRGMAGNDKIFGADGDDFIFGDNGNDTLTGGSGKDDLYGGAGDDLLQGGRGNDRLWGGAGHDLLSGDAGKDRLEGGLGNDTLTGGAAADRFIFKGRIDHDRITDFNAAEGDRLVLDDAFWGGQALSAATVVRTYASLTAEGVLFDFGSAGSILLEDLNTLASLSGALELV